MNVYDFDDTIFRGDSTRAFWAYCLKRAPGLARFLPRQCAAAVRYALGRTAKEAFKEAFFSFLQGVPDADAWAEDFWRTHERRFRPWYLAQKQPDDLVISASPEFLLAPACRRLGIRPPIASLVDARTGRYTGLNCKGAEKVSRFREQYPDAEIGQFYSDSRSDAPLAHLARRAFLVRGDSYTSWEV